MASDDLESQVVLLRSQLMQAEEAGRQAREDLSRVTQECMQLQASKVLCFTFMVDMMLIYG